VLSAQSIAVVLAHFSEPGRPRDHYRWQSDHWWQGSFLGRLRAQAHSLAGLLARLVAPLARRPAHPSPPSASRRPALGDAVCFFEGGSSCCQLVSSLQPTGRTGFARQANCVGLRAPAHTWNRSSQRTRRTRRRGNPSELGRLVMQAWQAQVTSVIYVLTRLEDRRGWVTKSTLCAECHRHEGTFPACRHP